MSTVTPAITIQHTAVCGTVGNMFGQRSQCRCLKALLPNPTTKSSLIVIKLLQA